MKAVREIWRPFAFVIEQTEARHCRRFFSDVSAPRVLGEWPNPNRQWRRKNSKKTVSAPERRRDGGKTERWYIHLRGRAQNLSPEM